MCIRDRVGILFASVQSDLKKLLAFSTIENVGILGMALALPKAIPRVLTFSIVEKASNFFRSDCTEANNIPTKADRAPISKNNQPHQTGPGPNVNQTNLIKR